MQSDKFLIVILTVVIGAILAALMYMMYSQHQSTVKHSPPRKRLVTVENTSSFPYSLFSEGESVILQPKEITKLLFTTGETLTVKPVDAGTSDTALTHTITLSDDPGKIFITHSGTFETASGYKDVEFNNATSEGVLLVEKHPTRNLRWIVGQVHPHKKYVIPFIIPGTTLEIFTGSETAIPFATVTVTKSIRSILFNGHNLTLR